MTKRRKRLVNTLKELMSNYSPNREHFFIKLLSLELSCHQVYNDYNKS